MGPRAERAVTRAWAKLAPLLALATLSCAEAHPPVAEAHPPAGDALPEDTLPAGRLGHPIGTYLQLEGVRAETGKVGDQTLSVERVGERSLSPPSEIWIENLHSLPRGERCVLRGYETGRWIGVPPSVEASGDVESQQAMWQFYRYFIATSVQEPPALVEQFRVQVDGR